MMIRFALSLGLALLSTLETCGELPDGPREPGVRPGEVVQQDLGAPCDPAFGDPYTGLCDPPEDPHSDPILTDLGTPTPPPEDPYDPAPSETDAGLPSPGDVPAPDPAPAMDGGTGKPPPADPYA